MPATIISLRLIEFIEHQVNGSQKNTTVRVVCVRETWERATWIETAAHLLLSVWSRTVQSEKTRHESHCPPPAPPKKEHTYTQQSCLQEVKLSSRNNRMCVCVVGGNRDESSQGAVEQSHSFTMVMMNLVIMLKWKYSFSLKIKSHLICIDSRDLELWPFKHRLAVEMLKQLRLSTSDVPSGEA